MIGSFINARRLPVVVGALAVVALALVPGTAAAATPIGPNQIFIAEVNGSAAPVSFDVVCPGTANTGHAVGDTVGVVKLQDPIPGFGRTGNASSIAVDLLYTNSYLFSQVDSRIHIAGPGWCDECGNPSQGSERPWRAAASGCRVAVASPFGGMIPEHRRVHGGELSWSGGRAW